MRSVFKIGYMYLSLRGKQIDVRLDLAWIKYLESSLGLILNRHKRELYSKTELTGTEFKMFEKVDMEPHLLLGAPLFRGHALDRALIKHIETVERPVMDLIRLRAQAAVLLLRASFGPQS